MKTYQIEIITPCFCAGANQAQAEVRAPSIRGQLRWWLRALGGSARDEKAIFGGVHALPGEKKTDAARASRIVVRIGEIKRGAPWPPFRINPNAPESYIWYYASVSADRSRWTKEGNIPHGTTFALHLLERLGGVPASCRTLYNDAVEAFLRFGCIGLRATRGLGALHCPNVPHDMSSLREAAQRLLERRGFAVFWTDRTFENMRDTMAFAGDVLKNNLRAHCKVNQQPDSPLGNSRPRHASAVHLRPVKCTDGLRLLLFEAPHDRVLPAKARRPSPLLAKTIPT